MDFGGFILFALLALGLFFGGIVVAVLGIKRSPVPTAWLRFVVSRRGDAGALRAVFVPRVLAQ